VLRGGRTTDVDIFDDDVFLVSHPRSGNTWIRLMLRSLIVGSWGFSRSCTIDDVVPDIHRGNGKELRNRPRPRILKKVMNRCR